MNSLREVDLPPELQQLFSVFFHCTFSLVVCLQSPMQMLGTTSCNDLKAEVGCYQLQLVVSHVKLPYLLALGKEGCDVKVGACIFRPEGNAVKLYCSMEGRNSYW